MCQLRCVLGFSSLGIENRVRFEWVSYTIIRRDEQIFFVEFWLNFYFFLSFISSHRSVLLNSTLIRLYSSEIRDTIPSKSHKNNFISLITFHRRKKKKQNESSSLIYILILYLIPDVCLLYFCCARHIIRRLYGPRYITYDNVIKEEKTIFLKRKFYDSSILHWCTHNKTTN